MLICPYCINELKNKNKKMLIGWKEMNAETSMLLDMPCEWCDKYDELYEVKLFLSDKPRINNLKINQIFYKIKIRYGFTNKFYYLSYPLQGMISHEFYAGYNSNKFGIIVSEEAMKRDVLQLYLAYHDYILERVDISNKNINEHLIFRTKEDFGEGNLIQMKKQRSSSGYWISVSENDFLKNKFDNCVFYKLKTEHGWIGENFNITDNPDCCMVFSNLAILNYDLQNMLSNINYEKTCVDLPCHFGKIFYNQKDIQYYIKHM